MSYLKAGDYWPPSTADRNRIEKYKENKNLFLGQHDDIFAKVQRQLDSADEVAMTYIVANYCGLVSKLSADFLFGENPSINADNDKVNIFIQDIINSNKLMTGLYENAIGNSYRGDSCFKVRYAKKSKYFNEMQVLVEALNPRYYFTETSIDDNRNVERQIVGWDFIIEDDFNPANNRKYLKLEVHEPGKIYNYLYQMMGNKVYKELDIKTFWPYLEEEEETGIDDFLIVHTPNFRIDEDYWGIDDYVDIRSLQDEANNRISQIARVLDKHADPKMKGPQDFLDENGNVPVSGGKYFPYRLGEPEPDYITWEAKLESSFKQVDQMLKMMFLVTETSPEAFGLSESGVQESGRALKYRLMRTIAKINRKKRYYDEAIKQVIYLAQEMQVNNTTDSFSPERPNITWQDGLPNDSMAIAEETETMGRAGAISTEQKVRKNNPDKEEKWIQEEVARIEAEKSSEQIMI